MNNNLLTPEQMTARILSLDRAVFGDPDTNDIGMKRKVDELHATFVNATGAWRVVKFTIVTLGTLAASILAIIELIKKR